MLRIPFILLIPLLLFSKTLFTQEMIELYLNEINPYYYNSVAKERVIRENENSFKSVFDTQLNAKYDTKRYPTTEGDFSQVDVTKSIANGMEFSVAYRNAQGTQEYNNIKTGEDGEVFTSVNIPLLSLLNNTSKNELDLQVAQLKTKELSASSKKNILKLYFLSSKIYFELLLYKSIYSTEKELLGKAQINYDFIQKEILGGKRPRIALIDVKSQIINRKQRLLSAQNRYQNAQNVFLKYLNLSKETFEEQYILPSIKIEATRQDYKYDGVTEIVIKNRPEFQEIEYLLDKIEIKSQYNDILKYPKFDIKLNGVYDLEYKENGYKVAMAFNFPLERSYYKGKNESYKKERVLLQTKKLTIKNDIETDIQNIIQKASLQEQNILLASEEIGLVQQLEMAERRRYQEGLGSLLFVNQREILTLKAKQKLLHYYYKLQLLHLELKYESGTLVN